MVTARSGQRPFVATGKRLIGPRAHTCKMKGGKSARVGSRPRSSKKVVDALSGQDPMIDQTRKEERRRNGVEEKKVVRIGRHGAAVLLF